MKSSIKMQPRGFDSTYLTVTPRVLFNTYSPLSPLFKMAAFIPIPCRIPELHSLTLPRQMVYGRSSTLRLGCHRPFALSDEKCRCCWILEGPSALCYTSVPLPPL
mgnify:CR=1 FL=1